MRMYYVRCIIQVENGQHDHFRQLERILVLLDSRLADRSFKNFHVKFGHVEGMSTRHGDVVFLRDILDEAKALTLQTMKTKESKFFFNRYNLIAIKLFMCLILVNIISRSKSILTKHLFYF